MPGMKCCRRAAHEYGVRDDFLQSRRRLQHLSEQRLLAGHAANVSQVIKLDQFRIAQRPQLDRHGCLFSSAIVWRSTAPASTSCPGSARAWTFGGAGGRSENRDGPERLCGAIWCTQSPLSAPA